MDFKFLGKNSVEFLHGNLPLQEMNPACHHCYDSVFVLNSF